MAVLAKKASGGVKHKSTKEVENLKKKGGNKDKKIGKEAAVKNDTEDVKKAAAGVTDKDAKKKAEPKEQKKPNAGAKRKSTEDVDTLKKNTEGAKKGGKRKRGGKKHKEAEKRKLEERVSQNYPLFYFFFSPGNCTRGKDMIIMKLRKVGMKTVTPQIKRCNRSVSTLLYLHQNLVLFIIPFLLYKIENLTCVWPRTREVICPGKWKFTVWSLPDDP